MKIRNLVLPLLLTAGFVPAAVPAEPLACNINALSKSERERHRVLSEKMSKAVVRRDELSNGYALLLDRNRIDLADLGTWVSMEARCCPFLDFGIDVTSKGTSVTLRLTGAGDVKRFLDAELK